MCKLCEKKPVYEFTNQRKLCRSCFIRWFEKKFFYTLRKFSLLEEGAKISFSVEKNYRGIVARHLINLWKKRANFYGKSKNSKRIVLSDTTDLISLNYVRNIFRNKDSKLGPKQNNKIRPLYLFLNKEVKLYADLLNLRYIPDKKKKGKVEVFIENLEKNHPEIKSAIIQSYLTLEN
jgi:hypothetical protein